MPTALLNEPELFEDLEHVWDAFVALHRTRAIFEHGAEAIKWSEIQAYLDIVGIHGSEARSEIVRLVLHMDNVFLEHVSKKG